MSATRSLWRSLLTVFQIVTLVAFSVAGAGHSHVGATHAGHPTVAAAHPEAPGPDQVYDASDRADRAGDEAATGSCGPCCGHASYVRWDGFSVTVAWKPERTLAGLHVIAFDSLPPETLPEPPRTIA
ncbi:MULTISPECIES: hypothetical protein [Methylobacterium]|uniref:hypothetical protein n=1 Tax=Methylobacterium TaxID=407 RepID=UPI002F31082F